MDKTGSVSKKIGVGANVAGNFLKNIVSNPNLSNLSSGLRDFSAGILPIAIAGTLAVDSIQRVGTPISKGRKIKSSRKQLKEYTPSLEDVDDKTIDDYFSVIKTFSPLAAKNPIVAGNLVNKMVEFGGVDHNLVKGLVDIESQDAKTRAALAKGGSSNNFVTLAGLPSPELPTIVGLGG